MAEGTRTTTDTEDGRRLRRERNREAVVVALLDLYREGNLDPSSDEITARAGISQRSLFRYFDDLDDLALTAIDRARTQVLHLVDIDIDPGAAVRVRAAQLVGSRAELWEEVTSAAQVTRLHAPFKPVVAEQLAATRSYLRERVRHSFTAELDAMTPDAATRVLAIADVLTSFETWRLLRDDQGLEPSQATDTITETLVTLIETGARP